jgi:phenylalanyl-tRNA synthetase beta subunit
LAVANPLVKNQSHMRFLLLLGLIEAFRCDLQNDNKYAKCFELGHVIRKLGDDFKELISVAFLIPAKSFAGHWDTFFQPKFYGAKHFGAADFGNGDG